MIWFFYRHKYCLKEIFIFHTIFIIIYIIFIYLEHNRTTSTSHTLSQQLIYHCRATGAQVYSYYDAERKKIFCLIRYPLEKLTKFADLVNFKMMLDPRALEDRCKAGDPESNIGPIIIGTDPSITPFSPYDHIYCRYVSTNLDDLFVHVPHYQYFCEQSQLYNFCCCACLCLALQQKQF